MDKTKAGDNRRGSKYVVSAVNYIRSHGLNHRQIQSLSEIDSEYEDALHHTEVRWLSRGTVLKSSLTLRLETEMFMNEKGKVVAKVSDEKWLWDISHYVNDLNDKRQGQQKLICDTKMGCLLGSSPV
jgi:hypothetical protein